MVSINTNILNLKIQRNLNSASTKIQTIFERLSTGFRINSAKDDAAGLYINKNLDSQIRGLQQANRNAQDGINILDTADGALSLMTENLLKIRNLALQSANGTYTTAERNSMQLEADQLIEEINRIQNTTKYDEINIFKGIENTSPATVSGGGKTLFY